MADEVKEFKASEVIKEANKAMEKSDKIEKKVEKKVSKKSNENPIEVLADAGIKYTGSEAGAQAVVNTFVKKIEVKAEDTQNPEVKEPPKPKKKGKVIAVRKASIIVLDENGKGVTLFGYKNVKVGDTVVY